MESSLDLFPAADPSCGGLAQSLLQGLDVASVNQPAGPEKDSSSFIAILTQGGPEGHQTKILQCRCCGKRYGRLDHIKRHYLSHADGRAYRCRFCPKSFNRKDLLDRHQFVHGVDHNSSERTSKRKNRTTKACRRCILAKTRCSDERPCRRCRDRGHFCGPNIDSTQPHPTDATVTSVEFAENDIADGVTTSAATVCPPGQAGPSMSGELEPMADPDHARQNDVVTRDDRYASTSIEPPFAALQAGPEWNASSWDGFGFLNDPTSLSNDCGLNIEDDNIPAMDLEWCSLIDPACNQAGQAAENWPVSTERPQPYSTNNRRSRILSGHEAFKRSLWLWDPDPRDSACREEAPQLSEAEERFLLPRAIFEEGTAASHPLTLSCASNARDALLLLVQQNSGSNVVIRSFPSTKMLTFLLKTFVAREKSSRCPFIHIPSMVLENCRPELLAAMIAAGSTSFGIHQIWKLGLALQERTRLAIYRSLDHNNSVARSLDMLQAQILWIESGLWSGSRRKMEVAESAANNVPTMIRRAGAFHQGYYGHESLPLAEDNGGILRAKWVKWVESESFKRSVFRALIDDVQSSVAYMRNPSFFSTEISFILPASRDAWEALNPYTWKDVCLNRRQRQEQAAPTLLDVIQDASILQTRGGSYDREVSIFTALHCLWPQQAAFLDAKSLHRRNQVESTSSILWLEAQRQDLYKKLTDMESTLTSMKTLSAEAHIVCELFKMALFISPSDIQRLAGRFGIKESRAAVPSLQAWSETDELRYAMWHAGQVLRVAESMDSARLHGFYAIAVYQACLTLASPFLLHAFGSDSSAASPEPEVDPMLNSAGHGNVNGSLVVLNGREGMLTKTYLLTGQGSPALNLGNTAHRLCNVEMIPTLMGNIFGCNHSSTTDTLPPLLQKLVSLTRDLTGLTRRPD